MRRVPLPLALPLALLLAVTGCTSDDGDGDDDGGGDRRTAERPDLDEACAELDEAEASAVVGVPVTMETVSGVAGATCTYSDEGEDGLVSVFVLREDASFDGLEDLARSVAVDEDEVTTEPLDVAGAEEGLVVTDTDPGLAGTQVWVRADGLVYQVYPTGLTPDDDLRIATATAELVLGGTADPADAVDRTETVHPCDLLTGAEASRGLGVRVTAGRADSTAGTVSQCVYEAADDVVLSLVDIGRTVRVDNLAASTETPGEQVAAPEPLVAWATPDGDATDLYVATDRTVLALDVENDDARAREVAEALLPALVP